MSRKAEITEIVRVLEKMNDDQFRCLVPLFYVFRDLQNIAGKRAAADDNDNDDDRADALGALAGYVEKIPADRIMHLVGVAETMAGE